MNSEIECVDLVEVANISVDNKVISRFDVKKHDPITDLWCEAKFLLIKVCVKQQGPAIGEGKPSFTSVGTEMIAHDIIRDIVGNQAMSRPDSRIF